MTPKEKFGLRLSLNEIQPRFLSKDLKDLSCFSRYNYLTDKQLIYIANKLIGIEIEIEGVDRPTMSGYLGVDKGFWIVKEDHSLRNHGYEYITRYGLRAGCVCGLLERFDKCVENIHVDCGKSLFIFSERCSVHVHLDVRLFTEEQLRSVLILYTLFEDPLFRFSGEDRKANVFTIPLRSSINLDERYDSFWEMVSDWQKYCAINLGCLARYGTIEFRHLGGTSDSGKINQWIIFLILILYYAERNSLSDIQKEVENIKYESQYDSLLTKVFGEYRHLLIISPREFDDACSDSKVFFGED